MSYCRIALFVTALAAFALASPPAASGAQSAAARRTDAEVAFTYGLKAYNQGDDAEAARRFEQAVADDPEHAAAHYFLGLVYLQRGEPERAAAAFERSLGGEHEAWIERREIEQQLGRARRPGGRSDPEPVVLPLYGGELTVAPRAPRLEGRLGAAFGSDSNPGLLPASTPVLFPSGQLVTGEDSDTVTSLDLRLAAYPFIDRGGWSLGLVADGRQALFGDLDFLDLGQGRVVASLAWGGDPLGYLSGPLGYTRVPRGSAGTDRFALLLQAGSAYRWLDGESFARSDEVALALTLRQAPFTATQLDLEFHDDRFFINPQASGERLGVRLSQYFFFGARCYLRPFAAAAERDAGAAFDSSTLELGTEFALPLGRRAIFYVTAARAEEEYDRIESNPFFPLFFADAPRDDTVTRAAAALSYSVSSRLLVTGRVSYLDRETDAGATFTLADLDAERTVATLGFSWFF